MHQFIYRKNTSSFNKGKTIVDLVKLNPTITVCLVAKSQNHSISGSLYNRRIWQYKILRKVEHFSYITGTCTLHDICTPALGSEALIQVHICMQGCSQREYRWFGRSTLLNFRIFKITQCQS